MPGSGESMPGIADSDSRFDDCGLPYMNAKTLKGHLREKMEWIQFLSNAYEGISIDSLLGSEDMDGTKSPARIFVSDLTLPKDVHTILYQAEQNEKISTAEVEDALSLVLTTTRIGENGVAADHSLRKTRVVRKGLTYEAHIAARNLSEKEEALLFEAVRAIQHLGTGKSRGFGVVSCSIGPEREDTAVQSMTGGEGRTIRYELYLNEPVKMGSSGNQPASESRTFVYGSSIRGAVIGALLSAGEDQLVPQVLDSCRFSNAYPMVNQQKLVPCPSIFFASKYDVREAKRAGKQLTVNLRIAKEAPEEEEKPIGVGQYCAVGTKNLQLYNVEQTAKLHVSVRSGEMFRYEAIEAGQTFYGSITCPDGRMAEKIETLISGQTYWIGGSRSAGYGKCTFVKTNREKPDRLMPTRNTPGILTVYALSDLILLDDNGCECGEVSTKLLEKKLGIRNVTLLRSYVTITRTRGFNFTWHAGQIERSSVSCGSIFFYSYEGSITRQLADAFEREGVGLRRNEGFGQILIDPDFSAGMKEMTKEDLLLKSTDPLPQKLDPDVRDAVSRISERVNASRLDQTIRARALTCAEKNKGIKTTLTDHQIAKIYSLLDDICTSQSENRNASLRNLENFVEREEGKTAGGEKAANIGLKSQKLFINTNGDAYPVLHVLQAVTGDPRYQDEWLKLKETVKTDDEFCLEGIPESKLTENQITFNVCRYLLYLFYDLMREESDHDAN